MIALMLSDQTALSIFFCVVQVTVFAALGALATRWLISHRPQIALTVACTVVGVIVFLTLAIPFSVPRWLVVETNADRAGMVGQDTCAHVHAGLERTPVVSPGDLVVGGLLIDIRDFLNQFRSRVKVESQSGQSVSVSTLALTSLGLGTLVGFIRFAISIAATWSLMRRCENLNDDRAAKILSDLCARSKVRHSVGLLESNSLSGAAVVGVFRPRILLPSEWIDWSDAELNSVLAHELAHVAGGDFAWRAMSAVAGALHFYNPLVHYLIRSMVLAQEIAADITAASAVDRSVYIRSLSVLALRRDQFDAGCARVGIAPVFSGYLIRRIRMLSSKEDLGLGRVSNRLRIAVAMMLVACGLVAFTMRGYAEPPVGETPQAPDAAVAPVARIARASRPVSQEDPIAGLFQRKCVRSADVADNKTGMVEIRLAEILKHRDFAPLVSIANSGLADEIKAYLELDESPSVDMSLIEVIFGSAQVAVRPAAEKGKSVLMFGSGLLHFRFKETVDAESWTKKHVAGASEKQVEGATFLEIPEVPMLGPASVLIANRDPRTFCIGSLFRVFADNDELVMEKREREFVESVNRPPQPNTSSWANTFDQVKGGLYTLAFTKEEFQIPEEFDPDDNMSADETEARRIFHRLQHSFETVAIGVDMSDEGTRFGLRVHISAADDARLEILSSDIRELVRFARRELEKPVEGGDQEIEDPQQRELAIGIYRQIFDRMIIEQVSEKDSSSYVAIRSSIEHPSLASMVASFVLADFQAE